MKKNWWNIVPIIVFVFALIAGAGFIVYGVSEGRTTSELENRELAKFPRVKLSSILSGKFEEKFGEAVSDYIFLRDECVTVKTYGEYALGKRLIDNTFIEDDMLIETYQDTEFDDAQISENIDYVTEFMKMVAEGMGSDHVKMLLVPRKSGTYRDDLPSYVYTSDKPSELRDNIVKRLKEVVSESDDEEVGEDEMDDGLENPNTSSLTVENAEDMVVDLSDVMAKHKDEYIYFLTDHHWTSLGAFYGYCAYKGYETCEPDYNRNIKTDEFLGTDYSRVHFYKNKDSIWTYPIPEAENATITVDDSGDIREFDSIYAAHALDTSSKYNYFLDGDHSAVTIHTGCDNGKTLILIKDSYANSLVPYLCQDYETILVLDLRHTNGSVFSYLQQLERVDDVLLMYNEVSFMTDNHMYNLQ